MDLPVWATLLILAAVAAGSLLVGHWLARSWRMDDYGMKLSVVIGSVSLAAAICILLWPPRLGIDLSGGTILIYEIDEEATQRQQADQGQTLDVTAPDVVPAILLRLNPSGLEDVVVRPYGEDQVEVIIPRADQAATDRIKSIISTAGFLEFRIVANTVDHGYIIEAALDEANRGANQIRDEEGNVIGLWARLGRETGGPNRGYYRMNPLDNLILRDHETGRPLTDAQGNLLPEFLPDDPQEQQRLYESFRDREQGIRAVQEHFESLGIENIDVLMAADDGYDVRGDHIASVSAGFDEQMYPNINFTMTSEGAILFQGLTADNAPDPTTGFKRRLGILMDNALISAPQLNSMISGSGQITGRFTQQEVDDLVQIIRGGSLPAALTPQPTTESQISPLLGRVTIRQSAWALGISLAAVLVFMLLYYRFAGMVACFALLSNLVLILAVMILLKASFTLPGIAGLVLTVGMSVDANILIFERIREELARGAKARMALRNGFARATTTIIDSNVTTLITGVVLYVIGTDLIRGFAVTLILGILMSMFTAVFCSRVIFDIAERRHWFRELRMLEWVGNPRWDFLGKRRVAIAVSAGLIVLGMAGAVARGVDLFDIDLVGGTSVDVLLTEPHNETQMRQRLAPENFLPVYHDVVERELQSLNPNDPRNADRRAELDEALQITDFDLTLHGLPGYTDPEGNPLPAGRAWKIITSIPHVEHLEGTLQRLFTEGDRSLLVMRKVTIVEPPTALGSGEPKAESEEPKVESRKPEVESEEPKAEGQAADDAQPQAAAPDDPRGAKPQPPTVPNEAEATEGARRDLPGPNVLAMGGVGDLLLLAQADAQPVEPPPAQKDAAQAQEPPPAAPEGPAAGPVVGTGRSRAELNFDYAIGDDALQFQVAVAAREVGIELLGEDVEVQAIGDSRTRWTVELPLSPEQAQRVLERLQQDFANQPVFPSASKVGSKVAADMQGTALKAILFSLFGIVVYLWIRFQRVAYGLAAVIATVHDVLVTLGAVALSYWLAPFLGILLVENFKISLSVIAAFLTLIGYSLNDTIVTFDRIRELRGKSPHLNFGIVNEAVNQTLSRTLLTAGTTLVTIGVLYAIGGQGIRGFAFAMLVGVVVGTYSSIYIAAPVLLWLTEGAQKVPETPPAEEKLAQVPAERP